MLQRSNSRTCSKSVQIGSGRADRVREIGALGMSADDIDAVDVDLRVERFGCRATESFESLQIRIRSEFRKIIRILHISKFSHEI